MAPATRSPPLPSIESDNITAATSASTVTATNAHSHSPRAPSLSSTTSSQKPYSEPPTPQDDDPSVFGATLGIASEKHYSEPPTPQDGGVSISGTPVPRSASASTSSSGSRSVTSATQALPPANADLQAHRSANTSSVMPPPPPPGSVAPMLAPASTSFSQHGSPLPVSSEHGKHPASFYHTPYKPVPLPSNVQRAAFEAQNAQAVEQFNQTIPSTYTSGVATTTGSIRSAKACIESPNNPQTDYIRLIVRTPFTFRCTACGHVTPQGTPHAAERTQQQSVATITKSQSKDQRQTASNMRHAQNGRPVARVTEQPPQTQSIDITIHNYRLSCSNPYKCFNKIIFNTQPALHDSRNYHITSGAQLVYLPGQEAGLYRRPEHVKYQSAVVRYLTGSLRSLRLPDKFATSAGFYAKHKGRDKDGIHEVEYTRYMLKEGKRTVNQTRTKMRAMLYAGQKQEEKEDRESKATPSIQDAATQEAPLSDDKLAEADFETLFTDQSDFIVFEEPCLDLIQRWDNESELLAKAKAQNEEQLRATAQAKMYARAKDRGLSDAVAEAGVKRAFLPKPSLRTNANVLWSRLDVDEVSVLDVPKDFTGDWQMVRQGAFDAAKYGKEVVMDESDVEDEAWERGKTGREGQEVDYVAEYLNQQMVQPDASAMSTAQSAQEDAAQYPAPRVAISTEGLSGSSGPAAPAASSAPRTPRRPATALNPVASAALANSLKRKRDVRTNEHADVDGEGEAKEPSGTHKKQRADSADSHV